MPANKWWVLKNRTRACADLTWNPKHDDLGHDVVPCIQPDLSPHHVSVHRAVVQLVCIGTFFLKFVFLPVCTGRTAADYYNARTLTASRS